MQGSFEELASAVYEALRDDSLHADTVVELAWAADDPYRAAVREALERPTADLTAADVWRLGAEIIKEYAVGREALERAVQTVQRDLDTTGIGGTLRLVAPEWDMGGLRVEYQGQTGGYSLAPQQGMDRVAEVADGAQEAIAEVLWTSWPVCPQHGLGLHPSRDAAWRCLGRTHHTVAKIGELPG